MKWKPVTRGQKLDIDWREHLGKPIDPYLVWGDLCGFAGSSDGSDPKQRPVPAVRLALELKRQKSALLELGSKEKPNPLAINPVVSRGSSLYATAAVHYGRVGALLNSKRLKRAELGFTGLMPQRGAPRPINQVSEPVVAIIDFGCAFAHERFRHLQGGAWKTRIAYLWDQSRRPDVSAGPGPWKEVWDFGYGREMLASDIDALVAARSANGRVDEDEVYLDADYNSVNTVLTHGTHVLDLAAGAGLGSPARAPKIIFVQLPDYAVNDTSGGSMVTHVMDAMRYILRRIDPLAPLVVNLSYGSMAGPHDGSTILESVMDAVVEEAMGPLPSERPSRYLSIVLPAGNNFESDCHAVVRLDKRHPTQTLQWHVLPEDPTDTFLELWYPRRLVGDLVVEIQPPDGPAQRVKVGEAVQLRSKAKGPLCAVMHLARASSGRNDASILIALAPTDSDNPARARAPSGIWTVKLSLAGKRRPVDINAWVERDDPPIGSGAPPRQSRLLTGSLPLAANQASPPDALVRRKGTGNSIANGSRTVVVGACLAAHGITFSGYSSAGPSRGRRAHWPDLVAQSDVSRAQFGVPAAGTRGGTLVRMNGTSVAAPQVARALIGAFLPYKKPPRNSRTPTPPKYGLTSKIAPCPAGVDAARAGRGRLRR